MMPSCIHDTYRVVQKAHASKFKQEKKKVIMHKVSLQSNDLKCPELLKAFREFLISRPGQTVSKIMTSFCSSSAGFIQTSGVYKWKKHNIYYLRSKSVNEKSCDSNSDRVKCSVYCNGCNNNGGIKIVVVVVAFSSHVRIWGECSTIHSPPALLFFESGD